ncbi:hypothetical protein D3C73_614640 [compost metagenome]
MGEARLELVGADLLVAGMALRAMAAAGDEGYGDAIADLEAHHALALCRHLAGQFMARNMRQLDIRVMALPAVPVAAAEAGRANLDDNTAEGRLGIGKRPDLRHLFERFVIHGLHDAFLACSI